MDDMDRLLAKLPGENPPADLAERICFRLSARQRKIARLHLVSAFFLAIFGLWLALPTILEWSFQTSLPNSGLALILSSSRVFGNEFFGVISNSLQGLLAFQAGFQTSLDNFAWLGLAALGIGALLGAGALLKGFSS
jgi:hypothetical protein